MNLLSSTGCKSKVTKKAQNAKHGNLNPTAKYVNMVNMLSESNTLILK